ncbi:MAG TPA: amino acid ABC transporter permease [Aquificae bacterium]|nr:amino acid ABC transporter permease [Aquificota bacterium]
MLDFFKEMFNIVIQNKSLLLKGFFTTLKLAFLVGISSLILGTIIGFLRTRKNPIIKWPVFLYIEIIRGTPLIMVIFWVYSLFPKLLNRPIDPFLSAYIAMTIFESAYIAEIIRAGIESISKGIIEAALAFGLRPSQIARYIVLPIALRNMIPALTSQFIAMFKDTSLAYIIGVIELTRAAVIINNRLYLSFEVFSFVALVYFSISWN